LAGERKKKAAVAKDEAGGARGDVLGLFHAVTAKWFRAVFEDVTAPQREGWPAIARGESTLILAPTGTGKTLTAFLWCLDRLMLHRDGIPQRLKPLSEGATDGGAEAPPLQSEPGCRVVYISPLKALAVDVERNLRSPLAGIANMAEREGVRVHRPRSACGRGTRRRRSGRGSSGIRERF
jgi:ATP-dependent Lhr-like helicase